MPMNKANYLPNWEAISQRIRFGRAAGRCECRGECGAHDGDGGKGMGNGCCEAAHGRAHPITGSKVILTTAHLDHDTANNADDNLAAYCQRCHLNYDKDHHARNAAITRREQRIAAGQLEFVFWD